MSDERSDPVIAFLKEISFVNELGNQITMTIEEHDHGNGITVTVTGPTGTVEHTWTPAEARTLYALLHSICP